MESTIVGKHIKVIEPASYTLGESGTILEILGDVILIKLDNIKKYTVPYRYLRKEIKVIYI